MSNAFVARNWRDLIKPKTVPVEDATATYGKFVCEPLERGFGITLGNALRRVLLSSLQGTAITAAKIDGALHEFTSVPDVVEEIKWRKPSNPRGVPVWSHNGMICTGETYKDKVKLTFAHGASLADPAGLFNSSLGGATRRAIDLFEGDTIDEAAFRSLVQDATAFNAS